MKGETSFRWKRLRTLQVSQSAQTSGRWLLILGRLLVDRQREKTAPTDGDMVGLPIPKPPKTCAVHLNPPERPVGREHRAFREPLLALDDLPFGHQRTLMRLACIRPFM